MGPVVRRPGPVLRTPLSLRTNAARDPPGAPAGRSLRRLRPSRFRSGVESSAAGRGFSAETVWRRRPIRPLAPAPDGGGGHSGGPGPPFRRDVALPRTIRAAPAERVGSAARRSGHDNARPPRLGGRRLPSRRATPAIRPGAGSEASRPPLAGRALATDPAVAPGRFAVSLVQPITGGDRGGGGQGSPCRRVEGPFRGRLPGKNRRVRRRGVVRRRTPAGRAAPAVAALLPRHGRWPGGPPRAGGFARTAAAGAGAAAADVVRRPAVGGRARAGRSVGRALRPRQRRAVDGSRRGGGDLPRAAGFRG